MNQTLTLWTSVLTGPVVWLCSFEARYAWVPWACTFQAKLALYLIALLSLVLNAVAGLIAWRQWKLIGVEAPGETGGAIGRSRFMALGGLVLSASFSLVIVAQTIPEVMLGSCE